MSSGGGSTSSTQRVPKELRPLFEQTGQVVQGLQGRFAAPSFPEFFQPSPQEIPGLTSGQEQIAQTQLERAFGPVLTSPEQQALQQIDFLTGGPLGQSPATLAAMEAVRTPVLNELALAGLGNSGAVGTELAGAFAPILAQEMALRAGVIPQLASIGQTEAQRQSQFLEEAFAGQEAGRQVDVQRALADFNDFLRRQGLTESLTTGLLSPFPSSFTRSVSNQDRGVFK